MKRLLASILLLWPVVAGATSYYVDGNCPSAGTGASTVCGATGPKLTIHDGILLLSGPGDILNIRGVHNAHDGESANFDGRYPSQKFGSGNDINPKNGSSGNPIVIQSFGWTANGTGETVYVEGTDDPNTGSPGTAWTACSGTAGACNSPCDSAAVNTGAGSNFPASVLCSNIWYVIPATSGMTLASGAERPDGVMTLRRTAASGVTTRYDSWVSPNLSGARLYVYWGNNANCTGSGNPWSCCSGSGTGTCNPWQAGNPKPYVFREDVDGFLVRGGSTYITIRGLTIRDIEDAGIQISGTNTANITVQDCHILYAAGNPPGGDYGISSINDNNITIDSNEIAYTGSEGVHTQAVSGTPTVITITKNYIHNHGDQSVMGPALASGTARAMILGDSGGGTGSGDYTGSTVSGNLSVDGKGTHCDICLENHSDNWVIRDNVILRAGGECIKLLAAGTVSTNGNQIYNNLLIACGTQSAGQGAILLAPASSGSCNNNIIYNNTIVNPVGFEGIDIFNNVGTVTGNLFRNNIIYDTGSKRLALMDATAASNVFENNLVYSTGLGGGSTLVKWGATNYTCAQIANIASTDLCNDPLFVNIPSSDYHIQTTSPAKDAGTSAGMPSGRTKDINNTLASLHGLPSYADNQALFGSAWDIGTDEFSTGVAPSLKLTKTHTPDPVIGGNNLTYTLQYSNSGATQTTGTTISDTIPANTSFVSATSGGTSDGTTVSWSIGVLAGGGSGSVQWVARVATGLSNGTIISNSSSITSNEQGPVSATVDTATVTALPFLTLAKSDQPDPVLAGSNITYTIAYANTGTGGATNVVITDVVPVNTTFVSATGGGTLSGSAVTWNIGAVNAGVNASVQLVVAVGGGVAAGSVITNQTYSLASTELPTVTGAPIATTVITSSPTSTNFVLPITQRQNSWTATQTDLFLPNADVVQGPNGAQWIRGQATEEVTLSTSGTTTDSSTNLLPANSYIEAVVARVTTTITVASNWKLGDSTQAARFTGVISGLTAGTTTVGVNQLDPTVASANLGPVQGSAAPVRITTTGTPGAGKIRITVFYRQYIPPGS